jgi:tripartite ATP-independent transporter DctM subunit
MSIAFIGFGALLLLCFLGFRVGFATLFVGFVGFAFVRGWEASLAMVGQQVFHDANNYNLSVIPLFVLMGVFIYRSDVSSDLYDSAYSVLGHLKGGLALATVLACGGFSAVCGSTLATAATMSKVAMPQMKAFDYNDRLAAGTIAAGGTLGIMIPPSVPLVIYGIIAEQDISLLFIAGILPGLLLVLLFLLAVMITVRIDDSAAPAASPLSPDRQKAARRGTLPVLILFIVVLGGIYGASVWSRPRSRLPRSSSFCLEPLSSPSSSTSRDFPTTSSTSWTITS